MSRCSWLWKGRYYCSRGKDHCKDVDVALVIITRVGVICKDVLGRFDILILVVLMLQWVSFANSKDVDVVVIITRVGVICKDVLARGR